MSALGDLIEKWDPIDTSVIDRYQQQYWSYHTAATLPPPRFGFDTHALIRQYAAIIEEKQKEILRLEHTNRGLRRKMKSLKRQLASLLLG